MKKQVVFAAVAGLASLATAQEFSLSIVPDDLKYFGSTTITLTVFGDATVGTHLHGGAFGVDIISSNVTVNQMQWTSADWSVFNTDGGFNGSDAYDEVIFGQLVLPPVFVPAAGSELGQAIGSFQIEFDEALNLFSDIGFYLVAADPFSLETVDGVTGETYQSNADNLTLGSFVITPAPSAVSLLGFGGLVASRRRRC